MSLYDDVYGSRAQTPPRGQHSPAQWRTMLKLDELEDREGLPRGTMTAVLQHESGGKPTVVSPTGAGGLFQLMPATAAAYKADRFHPEQSADAAAKELGQHYKRYGGDMQQTLAAWNWGSGNLQKKGLANAPAETKGFTSRVMSAIGPRSAEAATPSRSLYEDVYGVRPAMPEPEVATEQEATSAVDRLRQRQEQPDAMPPPDPATTAPAPTPDPAGLAAGTGAVQQAPTVTDPAALLAGGRRTPPADTAAAPAAATVPSRPASLVKITPEMDDDAILRELGYDPAVVKKAKGYTPGIFKKNVTSPDDASVLNNPLGGIAQGAGDVAYGAVQLGARAGQKLGLLDPADVAFYEALNKLREADYQQNIRKGAKVDPETGEPTGMFADPSRMVGEAIATPIPGLGPAKAGLGVAARVGRTALKSGAAGAVSGALQPVTNTSPTPGSPDDTYWQQKGTQTATGGIVGGVAGPVMEEVAGPLVNKTIGAVRGQMSAADQFMVDLGERYKVRLSAPDVQRGPVAPKVENFLENVPGAGVATWRRAQSGEASAAGTAVEERVADAMQRQGWRDLPALQQAAAAGGQRGKEARLLLDELTAAGNEPGAVIQGSSKLNLFQDRLQAEQLYDTVEQLAKPLGNMRPTRTTKVIDDAIARAQKDPLPSAEVRREVLGALERVRGEISPSAAQPQPSMATRNPVTGALQAQPVTRATILPDTTYSRMRQLRSDLGTLEREASEPAVARALGRVKYALETDMHEFSTRSNVPGLSTAAKKADTFYRERVVRYREGQLAKAAAKDLPDEIYNQFVRKGADRAKEFYNGLDPKGQAAVRYQMVADAMDKALKDPEKFAPKQFVDEMDRIQKATGVFFRGAQGDDIANYTRLLRHITHKGTSPAGLGFTGAAMGGGMFFHPPTLLKVLGAAHGLRLLFESKAGRAFMLASRNLPPGSPLMQQRLNQFMRTMPTGAAAVTGAAQGRQAAPEPVAPEED